jgi:hypothetical protein
VVSYVIVGGSGGILPQKMFVFFHPGPRTAFRAFSDRNRILDIQRYIILYSVDRPNLQLGTSNVFLIYIIFPFFLIF